MKYGSMGFFTVNYFFPFFLKQALCIPEVLRAGWDGRGLVCIIFQTCFVWL